tara:strand:+ start:316 stop:597 length:282 start_codon:yes stop_codon:yes gene_type:complete
LSRPDLIKKLKTKHPKLNKPQLETIIDAFFNSIEDALKQEKSVEIRGWGKFYIKKIKENYNSRNPKTGELIYVPNRNKIRFRASKKFNKFINQ